MSSVQVPVQQDVDCMHYNLGLFTSASEALMKVCVLHFLFSSEVEIHEIDISGTTEPPSTCFVTTHGA